MGIPKPKARRAEISQNDPPKQLKKLKPRKDGAQDVANVKPKGKFEDQHVRWTGYLTVDNNRYLRYLLTKEQIPSITRCVNEAVEDHLKKKFGLPSENSNND